MRNVPEPVLMPRKRRRTSGSTASSARDRETAASARHWRQRPWPGCVRPIPVPRRRRVPSSTSTCRTGAAVRISAPRASAESCHRLRDGAHAADGMAPHPALAVHLAEAMMQQHIGRAGRRRGREGADDAIERQRPLDDVALEPAVEEIGGAFGEEVEPARACGRGGARSTAARSGPNAPSRQCRRRHWVAFPIPASATRRLPGPVRHHRPAAARHPRPRRPQPHAAGWRAHRASAESAMHRPARSSPPDARRS